MAKHRSSTPGANLIERLAHLGQALGYQASTELPLRPDLPHAPAVDVAWLGDPGQRFPLMIFEIESRATNSASNNPVKVFGLSNEEFEKPLFFFHVFLDAGPRSTRLEPLRRIFGTYNYRAYSLGEGHLTQLLQDVFSQHRRLHKALRLGPVLDVLHGGNWRELELADVLPHIENLQFSAHYLAEYAKRAAVDPSYRHHFIRILSRDIRAGRQERQDPGYPSIIGRAWPEPIHIGLLALATPRADTWLCALQDWQERSAHLSQIGPHFGLSRDYDAFVLGAAPVLLALTAALMQRVEGAAKYVCEQLLIVLDRLGNARLEISFFTAIWVLHISAASKEDHIFERVRQFVNERGGVSKGALYIPPSMIDIDEISPEWTSALTPRIPVPAMSDFRSELEHRRQIINNPEEVLYRLALDVLTREDTVYTWAEETVKALHACYASNDVRP